MEPGFVWTWIYLFSVLTTAGGLLSKKLHMTQKQFDRIGENLAVKVKLTDNLKYDGRRHTMLITLTNQGNKRIKMPHLDLYFHSFFMVEPDNLPHPNGYTDTATGVRLHHINGMLFRMEFLPDFGNLLPGKFKIIKLTIKDWAVTKTDVPGNWYVTSEGLIPVVLQSTANFDQSFVEDFINPNQFKRYLADVYKPVTPTDRYNMIRGPDLGPDQVEYGVIPTPKQYKVDPAAGVTVDNSWVIAAAPSLKSEADYLSIRLNMSVVDSPRSSQAIVLELDSGGAYNNSDVYGDAYTIQTYDCNNVISVKGGDRSGVFYGIQTLLSLMTQDGLVQLGKIPGLFFKDEPRFGYRGLHLDVARNFHGKETVMELIDLMATYKLNRLHMHLSDDEAWRLEIPGLPELTSVASRRCHDLGERNCIIPQLASGPTASLPGSGHYTEQDYRDILRHAANRHVKVIPEFQMPSHGHAAIMAMEERYRRKDDINNLLTDLEDKSHYLSVQMFSDDAMNPCIESTYNFIRKIVETLKRLHGGILPLEYFNIGGEAVPEGAWVNSSACAQAFPNTTKADMTRIAKAYFLSRLAHMVIVQEGLRLAAYEDAFLVDGEPMPGGSDNILTYPYQNVWEWGLANRAYKFANNNYPVVMSPVTHLSFDHPYEPDPNERGLYWASRFTDTYKVFSLRPENLYDNIDVRRSGEPITRAEVCGVNDVNCDPLQRPENIKGIQAFSWSELIPDRATLHYMLVPRLLALAERAWHKAPWEGGPGEPTQDWTRFKSIVGHREFPRLDRAGIQYRVPPPGIAVASKDGQHYDVTMRTEFPGLRLQYSRNGGSSWHAYLKPFWIYDPSKTLLLRTVSADGRRASRLIGFSVADVMAQQGAEGSHLPQDVGINFSGTMDTGVPGSAGTAGQASPAG